MGQHDTTQPGTLAPFRIPETRLLAINDVVAQVTLTFRTSDDEELRHRYDRSPHLQQLILTTAISLVNCNYTSGMGRGPGFLIHQMRKKWPIGRRYIFTRHGDPLHSSMHKYFLQLEFTDEPADAMGEMVEIVEMRALGASPALSSYAGSMIDGLEAVELPEAEVLGYEAERHGSGHSGVTPAMRRASVADRPMQQQQQSPLMRARSVSRSSFGSVGQPSAAWDYQRLQYQPRTSPATRPVTSTGAVQQPVSAVSAASSATVGASVSPPGDGRLGRTAWYRSLHGISPLSRQPKSLSSEGEFFQPSAEGQDSQPAPPLPPRVAGAAPPVSRIPRPPASKPTAMASLASRLRRGVLAPLERRHAGRSAAEHPSSIPRPPSATSALSEQPSMPPPAATPRMQPRAHDSAVPSAVKQALLRRLRSPLGGFVDRAPSRASVRERIQAFDSLTVRGGTPEHEPGRSSFSDTPSGRSQDVLPPSMKARTRVPTDTGFISHALPVRPLVSRQSSRPLSRPSSPANTAVSVRSNVSARVMDTIQALERSAGQVEQNTGRAEHPARGSGVKRQAEAPPDFVSPTKRTRDEAESLVADKSHASSNPFAAMNRLVRKHTRRF